MTLLQVQGLSAGYGRLAVLHRVNITLERGEIAAIIGPNGAGKTTLLRSIVGMASVRSGTVTIENESLLGKNARAIRNLGVGFSPEGRHLFPAMSVRDNLYLGLASVSRAKRRAVLDDRLARVYSLFPILHERSQQAAGTLSGGQQQMLALARALMSEPRLLILDEPSMGLAPGPLRSIFGTVSQLRDLGIATIIVEQVTTECLLVADKAYVLRGGNVVDQGDASDFAGDPARLERAYFG